MFDSVQDNSLDDQLDRGDVIEKNREMLLGGVREGMEDMRVVFEEAGELPQGFELPRVEVMDAPVSIAYEASTKDVNGDKVLKDQRIVFGSGFRDQLAEFEPDQVLRSETEDGGLIEVGTPWEVVYQKTGEEVAHAVYAYEHPESVVGLPDDPDEMSLIEYDSLDREYHSLLWKIKLIQYAVAEGKITSERGGEIVGVLERRRVSAEENREKLV